MVQTAGDELRCIVSLQRDRAATVNWSFSVSISTTRTVPRALIVYSEQPRLLRGRRPPGVVPRHAAFGSGRVRIGRDFLLGIHRVFNQIDAAPLVTVAAVHGVVFGGGFELALTCDMIVADRTARFCFPELRLGLIPGFGGIPRLKRDLGNGLVRDLLMTGRSINATKAACGW